LPLEFNLLPWAGFRWIKLPTFAEKCYSIRLLSLRAFIIVLGDLNFSSPPRWKSWYAFHHSSRRNLFSYYPVSCSSKSSDIWPCFQQ